jgi:hypothetical protein
MLETFNAPEHCFMENKTEYNNIVEKIDQAVGHLMLTDLEIKDIDFLIYKKIKLSINVFHLEWGIYTKEMEIDLY